MAVKTMNTNNKGQWLLRDKTQMRGQDTNDKTQCPDRSSGRETRAAFLRCRKEAGGRVEAKTAVACRAENWRGERFSERALEIAEGPLWVCSTVLSARAPEGPLAGESIALKDYRGMGSELTQGWEWCLFPAAGVENLITHTASRECLRRLWPR